MRKLVLPLLLVAFAATPARAAEGFADYFNQVIDPAYSIAQSACTYTGSFRGWGWTCTLYDSLKTIRSFVFSTEGRVTNFLASARKRAFAGAMEAIGDQAFMQTINDYATGFNRGVDYWLNTFPDQLTEELEQFVYDATYAATDSIFSDPGVNDYPIFSVAWIAQNVRENGAMSTVMDLVQQGATKEYIEQQAAVERIKDLGKTTEASATERALHASKRTLSIAGDAGPLTEGTDQQSAPPAQTNAAATASPQWLDPGAVDSGTSLVPGVEPLSLTYKKMADSAVSSRDLLQIVSNELADMLSGQAILDANIAQGIAEQVRVATLTNDALGELIQLENRRILEEIENERAAIEAAAVRNTTELLNKVTQLAVAQKTLGSYTNPTAVEEATAAYSSCVQDPQQCDTP